MPRGRSKRRASPAMEDGPSAGTCGDPDPSQEGTAPPGRIFLALELEASDGDGDRTPHRSITFPPQGSCPNVISLHTRVWPINTQVNCVRKGIRFFRHELMDTN